MGGVIAAALLGFVKWTILFRRTRSRRRRAPLGAGIGGLMSGVFAMYLATKGLSRVWKPPVGLVCSCGLLVFLPRLVGRHPWVLRRARGMENRRKQSASCSSCR
jgi:inorganic phosphate transporter, PiT family